MTLLSFISIIRSLYLIYCSYSAFNKQLSFTTTKNKRHKRFYFVFIYPFCNPPLYVLPSFWPVSFFSPRRKIIFFFFFYISFRASLLEIFSLLSAPPPWVFISTLLWRVISLDIDWIPISRYFSPLNSWNTSIYTTFCMFFNEKSIEILIFISLYARVSFLFFFIFL